MIIRLVRMQFHRRYCAEFEEMFAIVQPKILAWEGCLKLHLLKDVDEPSTFLTLSHWKSEKNLEAYRNSALFENTWAKTKVWFSAKPEAWSSKIVL